MDTHVYFGVELVIDSLRAVRSELARSRRTDADCAVTHHEMVDDEA